MVVGIAVTALAAGVLFGQRWLVAFGVVFLAEELYETGVLALISGPAAEARDTVSHTMSLSA